MTISRVKFPWPPFFRIFIFFDEVFNSVRGTDGHAKGAHFEGGFSHSILVVCALKMPVSARYLTESPRRGPLPDRTACV